MKQNQILPPFKIHCCPYEHNDLCSKKWNAKFIDHKIICNCECHKKEMLDEKRSLSNIINSPSAKSGEYEYN